MEVDDDEEVNQEGVEEVVDDVEEVVEDAELVEEDERR